jgi:muramoyltetrapeptide carboxypeptidase
MKGYKNMLPERLLQGDEIRVIAPSTSFHFITAGIRETALKNLTALGLKVTYARNSEECDGFNSSPVASRVDDIHEAFSDPHIK